MANNSSNGGSNWAIGNISKIPPPLLLIKIIVKCPTNLLRIKKPFEELFATPQDIDFAQLAATYGIEHRLITSWQELQEKLNPLPKQGIRILEIRTNRKVDAKWRKENLGKFSQS